MHAISTTLQYNMSSLLASDNFALVPMLAYFAKERTATIRANAFGLFGEIAKYLGSAQVSELES
jgi:hypothetical protein